MRTGRSIPRRQFLAEASSLGAAGVLGLITAPWNSGCAFGANPAADGRSPSGGHGIMLDKVTVSVFAQYLGSKFRMHVDSGSVLEVELIEVKSLAPASQAGEPSGGRAPFSIVFRGPRQPVLPQKIYTLEHKRLETFEVFLVPIGPDAEGMRYEAIFN